MRFFTKKDEEQKLEVGDVIEAKIYSHVQDKMKIERYIVTEGRRLKTGNGMRKEVQCFFLIALSDARVVLSEDTLQEIVECFNGNDLLIGNAIYYRIIKNENIELREV